MGGRCWCGFGRCKGMTTVGAGGVCGADWGCWVAGYTQRSSTLFAVYGANNLCRGSPQREVRGDILGNTCFLDLLAIEVFSILG